MENLNNNYHKNPPKMSWVSPPNPFRKSTEFDSYPVYLEVVHDETAEINDGSGVREGMEDNGNRFIEILDCRGSVDEDSIHANHHVFDYDNVVTKEEEMEFEGFNESYSTCIYPTEDIVRQIDRFISSQNQGSSLNQEPINSSLNQPMQTQVSINEIFHYTEFS